MQVKLDIGSHVYPGCYEDCTGLLLSFFSTFASANSIFMESICLLGRPTMMETFQILDLFIFETPQCSFLGDRCVARVTRARLSRNIYSVLHVYTYICVINETMAHKVHCRSISCFPNPESGYTASTIR